MIQSAGEAASFTITLRAEDDRGDHRETADARIVQAIATLPTVSPLIGTPGVLKETIDAHLKCSERTVQRSLSRLEEVGRVSVTGYVSKKRPLYGVPGK